MNFPTIKESEYTYSKPITVKEWNNGTICVKVGYVRKHPEINCIVLEKRWKSRPDWWETKTFSIKDAKDWLKIRDAVEKLLPELAETPSSQTIEKAIKKVGNETELLELVATYPELLAQIPKDIDILSLPEDHKEALKKLLSVGGELANIVIKRLADEPIEDLNQFVKLLDELKLSTINSLVTHVTSRLRFIEMFEKAIHNDDSYERRGPESIHNLLKVNIWLLDQNYSVLHDDETLRNIILKEWDKDVGNQGDGKKRPDFLCMIDPLSQRDGYKKLVIVEIKRPTVKITFEHVKQMMEYKGILHSYSGKQIDSFECFLIGREVDPTLQINDLSNSGFVIKTYTDFISEARRFYQEYFKIIEQEHYAF